MKYNKFKEAECKKGDESETKFKMIKISSWESLKTMKEYTKTLVKSNSQNLINFKNPQASHVEVLRKEASLKDLFVNNFNINFAPISYFEQREQNSLEKDEENHQDSSYRIRWENLTKLYENKILENERLAKLNTKKDKRIFELEQNLKKLLAYNTKLENLNLKESSDGNLNEFFVSYDIQIMRKNKEIADLKQENDLLKKRSLFCDEELEKKFINRLALEKEKHETQVKQILLEKQMKIEQLEKELFIAKQQIKDFKHNYISNLEHDFAVNKLKLELKEITNRVKELETSRNRIEIKEENYLFTLQSQNFDKSLLENKSIGFEMSSISKSAFRQKSENEDLDDSVNEEKFEFSHVKLIETPFMYKNF